MKHSTRKPAPSLLLLSVASGLSPFGMAIVVPAMNSIALHHNAAFSKVQFVISAYLFGLAISQPVCGYLCDRIGRRPVMLCGFLVFIVASFFCAVAPTLDLLILGRFIQAVGVSVGTVASRAILRDCYDRNRMAEAMSYVSAAMGLAPITAPFFGGVLHVGTNYTAIFLGTALMGAIVFIGMARSLVETLPADIEPPRVSIWLKSYRQLLSSRAFVGNTLLFGFVQGGFFCFMAIGSALFATKFDIQPAKFGLLWGLMALNYVLGSTVAAKATPRIGTLAVIKISVGLSVLSGALVWAGANYGELTIFKVLFPLGLLMIAAGGITPGAMAGAVANHPMVAGTASGLSSAMGLVIGGSFSVIAGVMYTGDYQPIALLTFIASIAVAASWKLATIPQPGPT
jgi:DHA1 family bicyclomycin/chloramphenicol resistance-like MFS transporter